MSSSNLIRLGGLAAIVGGVVYAGVAFLSGPYFAETLYYMSEIGYGFVAVFLPLGAMAAIAALYALQGEHHGGAGAVASIVALVGLALATGALTVGVVFSTSLGYDSPFNWLLTGLFVASVGIVLLGGLSISAQILPWWCGVALIAGSPIVMSVTMVPSTALWGAFQALGGVPWILVGYAIFRAAGRRTERPARVR